MSAPEEVLDMARHRHDRGAAAVEFALILPLLVLLVMGIAEFGRAYHVQTTVSGAAREGVRVMALTNDQTRARTAAKSAASTLNPALTDSQITFVVRDLQTGTTHTNCGRNRHVTTTVTYPVAFITGLPSLVPGFPSSLTITGKGTMRCNG
jgi:Flp pilus assembly protein TadG